MIVKMILEQALDYSSGQFLKALEVSKGSKHDAIHLANWADSSIGIRKAINRLPSEHAIFMLSLPVTWQERTCRAHLQCATAAARSATRVARMYWTNYRGDGPRWDVLIGAIEDAETSVKDLIAAEKVM